MNYGTGWIISVSSALQQRGLFVDNQSPSLMWVLLNSLIARQMVRNNIGKKKINPDETKPCIKVGNCSRNALVSQGEIFLFVAANCKLWGCD